MLLVVKCLRAQVEGRVPSKLGPHLLPQSVGLPLVQLAEWPPRTRSGRPSRLVGGRGRPAGSRTGV